MEIEIPGQHGRLAVVTGSNSGTGLWAADGLARAGASVIMAVRNTAKGEKARTEILARHPGADVTVRRLDLADLASVQSFADGLVADEQPLDILINNAGVMMLPKRHLTADGLEMQIGTNFFGHFALSVRLLPLLLKAEAPRVVTMSSGNLRDIDFDNVNWDHGYDANGAYGQSKLADLLFSRQLARIADQHGWPLLSVGAHPGNASTSIYNNGTQLDGGKPILALRIGWKITPRHSAQSGAQPLLYAATRPDVVQAGYYGPRFGLIGGPVPVKVPDKGNDARAAERLWAEAERLTGVSLGSIGV